MQLKFPVYALGIALLTGCTDLDYISPEQANLKPINPAMLDGTRPGEKTLAFDTSGYPYAGIPRLAIETVTLLDPEDLVTEIPSRALFLDENGPTSDTLALTIRCRGNSTFEMEKKSFKIEFDDKIAVLGMPKNRDWALLANYSDKTLLKNDIAFRLSEKLKMTYTPRSRMVELFLNGTYRGVYQLTETVKVGRQRVNIPEDDQHFLIEADYKPHAWDDTVMLKNELSFTIHSPKNLDDSQRNHIRMFLESTNTYLENIHRNRLPIEEFPPETRFDLQDFIRFFWIQEFSKNIDGIFHSSVFFTWSPDDVIHMGPVWDFDIAFDVVGANKDVEGSNQEVVDPEGWFMRNHSWSRRLIQMNVVCDSTIAFWKANRKKFKDVIDSLEIYADELSDAADNNFKRWPIMKSTEFWTHAKAYSSYRAAVKDQKEWMLTRYRWIDKNLETLYYK